MRLFERFIAWVRALFGSTPIKEAANDERQKAADSYRNVDEINFAVIFGQKLANIAFSDGTMEITSADGGEPSKRAEVIQDALEWAMIHARKIATQAMATGGVVLVPTVIDDAVRVHILSQDRMIITNHHGDTITGAVFIAESAAIGSHLYYRLMELSLDGSTLYMRNRAVNESGGKVPLDTVDAWAEIPEEHTISGVEKLPFAFLRCPADNRKDGDLYGAEITRGSGEIVRQIKDHMRLIEREYKLTRPMLGLDSQMWMQSVDPSKPTRIDMARRTVQDSEYPFIPVQSNVADGSAPWLLYSPQIRDTAMYHRLEQLFGLLEKAVGTSRGILTERETAAATATEIKAANHDTFTWITAIRAAWETAMDDLAYAVDVYAEHFGLSPAGARDDYAITFDWDMSLFESSTETFNQLSELQSRGMISDAELRQWVRGGTLEEAQAAIDEIGKTKGTPQDAFYRALSAAEPPMEE